MASKVEAARRATLAGSHVVIGAAREAGIITRIVSRRGRRHPRRRRRSGSARSQALDRLHPAPARRPPGRPGRRRGDRLEQPQHPRRRACWACGAPSCPGDAVADRGPGGQRDRARPGADLRRATPPLAPPQAQEATRRPATTSSFTATTWSCPQPPGVIPPSNDDCQEAREPGLLRLAIAPTRSFAPAPAPMSERLAPATTRRCRLGRGTRSRHAVAEDRLARLVTAPPPPVRRPGGRGEASCGLFLSRTAWFSRGIAWMAAFGAERAGAAARPVRAKRHKSGDAAERSRPAPRRRGGRRQRDGARRGLPGSRSAGARFGPRRGRPGDARAPGGGAPLQARALVPPRPRPRRPRRGRAGVGAPARAGSCPRVARGEDRRARRAFLEQLVAAGIEDPQVDAAATRAAYDAHSRSASRGRTSSRCASAARGSIGARANVSPGVNVQGNRNNAASTAAGHPA